MSFFVEAATTLARVQVGGLTSGVGYSLTPLTAGYAMPSINIACPALSAEQAAAFQTNATKQALGIGLDPPNPRLRCLEQVGSAAIKGFGVGFTGGVAASAAFCPKPGEMPGIMGVSATTFCRGAFATIGALGVGFEQGLRAHSECK